MKGRWKLVGAGALLAAVLALVLWLQYAPVAPLPTSPLPPEAAPVPVAPGARPRFAAPSPPAPPAPGAPGQPTPPPPPDEGPSGIALFPPPGTKPIKRGIIVPEGYELPPGYVRHYQSTDDGQRLPAILMFHPLHTPRGMDGQPLPISPDRIVPPELAPKGMPVQVLVLPGDPGAPD